MSKLKVNQIETINNQPLRIIGDLIVDVVTTLSGSSGSNSSTTVSDFWVNNLNSTGSTLTVKNNLTVDGSVLGDYFYGDGSTLNNLPGSQISKSLGENSFVQKSPTESLSFGANISSLGVGGSSNGDVSIALGGGNTTGTKEREIPHIINGKYILFFDNVNNDFVTGNLKPKPVTDIKFTGLTQSTGITTTYKSQFVTGGTINGCINYVIANNTASSIPFTYTDCETGINSQISVMGYSTIELCSLIEPTYTYYSWMGAYNFPVVITQIGTCCDTIEVITATTITTIFCTQVNLIPRPFLNNCKTYQITNNIYPYVLDIQYTSCTNTLTSLILSDYEDTVCAIAPPTGWFGSSLGTAMTVTQISSQCCNTYSVYNPAWCPITAYYVDCFSGLTASTVISGYMSKVICSLVEPTFNTSCWSLSGYNPTIYSPIVTSLTGTNFCQEYVEKITITPLGTGLTVTVTTACTNSNAYITGLTGCINYIVHNNAPTNALLSYTDCLGVYHSFTLNTGSTTNFCSSNYPVVGISSAYTNSVLIIPSGTCETLCVNYEFTRSNETLQIPAIWDVKYLDCDFNEQTIKLKNPGDSIQVCAILGSVVNGSNISVSQLGSCLQQSNRTSYSLITEKISGGTVTISGLTLSNGYIFNGNSVRPINIINVITGTTTGGTIFISGGTVVTGITGTSTTVVTGSTSVTATTSTTGVTSVLSAATGCTVYTETIQTTYQTVLNVFVTGNTVVTGYTIVTASTIVTGYTEVDCNLVNTISGSSSNSGTTIVSGTTQITGSSVYNISNGIYVYVTGATPYTIIELSEELPLEFNSGKIVSNYFGLNSLAMGLQTQSKGLASVSQNMFTTAIGDGSHAEGCSTTAVGNCSHAEGSGTIANGKSSHSGGINSKTNHTAEFARSSGMFSTPGDAQYSLISLMGSTVGNTPSNMYVDGVSEKIKIYKNSIISITLQANSIVTNDAPGKGALEGEGAFFYGNSTVLKNTANNTLSIVSSSEIVATVTTNGSLSGTKISFVVGTKYDDYTELDVIINGISGLNMNWNGVITMVQSIK